MSVPEPDDHLLNVPRPLDALHVRDRKFTEMSDGSVSHPPAELASMSNTRGPSVASRRPMVSSRSTCAAGSVMWYSNPTASTTLKVPSGRQPLFRTSQHSVLIRSVYHCRRLRRSSRGRRPARPWSAACPSAPLHYPGSAQADGDVRHRAWGAVSQVRSRWWPAPQQVPRGQPGMGNVSIWIRSGLHRTGRPHL